MKPETVLIASLLLAIIVFFGIAYIASDEFVMQECLKTHSGVVCDNELNR